jgi:hypothetical protein
MKMLRTDGPVALEPHIEDPKASTVFGEYPKLLKDSTLIHMITDTLRLVVISSGTLDPMAVEDVMDNALKTHHHDEIRPADMLQGLADALPALGIVAAVLGVVKTMGSIDKPPSILGAMIGSALVGTFMGILLAYGIVSPFANRCKPGDRGRCRHLWRGQADHHRLAPRPPAAARDRGRALGHHPFEPAGLRRRVRRHARKGRTRRTRELSRRKCGPGLLLPHGEPRNERWPTKRGKNEPEPRPIIVKKIIAGGHGGHHGGAWKVAYADFVTAMMAFFLLMWILGATDREAAQGHRRLFHAYDGPAQAEERRIERRLRRRVDRRQGQLPAPRGADRLEER